MNRSLMHYQINSPRIVHETIDGETVMIDFENGAYFSTDQIGTKILEDLINGASIPEIVAELQLRYAMEHTLVASTVSQFVGQLQDESLIIPQQDAPTVAHSPDKQLSLPPIFTPPILNKYSDMQDLLLLDPIHDVEEDGWPKVNRG